MTKPPSKNELADGIRDRIASIDELLREYDELREEKKALEAALEALEGNVILPQDKGPKERSPREVVGIRRQKIKDLLAEDPRASTKQIAERVGESYQTVANDLRAIQDGK